MFLCLSLIGLNNPYCYNLWVTEGGTVATFFEEIEDVWWSLTKQVNLMIQI